MGRGYYSSLDMYGVQPNVYQQLAQLQVMQKLAQLGRQGKEQLGNTLANLSERYLPKAPGMNRQLFQSLEYLPVVQQEAFRRY